MSRGPRSRRPPDRIVPAGVLIRRSRRLGEPRVLGWLLRAVGQRFAGRRDPVLRAPAAPETRRFARARHIQDAQDLVSWLSDNAALRTTPAGSVDVGGLTGLSVDVELAPDFTDHPTWCEVTACVDFLHGEDAAPTWQWDLGVVSSERMRLYVLDAGDDLVAIVVDSIDGTTFDAVTERADAILGSLRFETP